MFLDGLEDKMCGLVLASGSKACPWPCPRSEGLFLGLVLGLGGLSSNARVEDKTRTENARNSGRNNSQTIFETPHKKKINCSFPFVRIDPQPINAKHIDFTATVAFILSS